jgi:single-strand DNA-binding protein
MNNSSAQVEGFVTQDPVLKRTNTGKTVCTFSIAFRHISGKDQEAKVSFLDIETWEKLAEFCAREVRKGRRTQVSGYLRQDRWEGQDAKMHSRVKLVGNQGRFIANASGGEQPGAEDNPFEREAV